MKLQLVALTAAFCAAALAAGGAEPKTSTIPARGPLEPQKRGSRYKVPRMSHKRRLAWGWSCELADGSGLSFGWLDTRADDGRPHTRVKGAGAWKRIDKELSAKNPLQKHCDRAWSLREKFKDALARARHIYLEGRTEVEERKFLAGEVNPGLKDCAADLAALMTGLRKPPAPGKYEAGQAGFALEHLRAAAKTVRPLTVRTESARLAEMRRAQIHLEIAAEALGAEPPPRVLSKIAWDARTRLYVVFGGEHFDYLTNDLWVFDPAKGKWSQRHPAGAPEPRADHHFDAPGDGKVKMRGGYTYSNKTGYGSSQYMHVGPGRWVYDVEKNAWTAESGGKKAKADARVYRKEPYIPEHYVKGGRPDAAAHEARLKSLAVNTWVAMNPPARFPRCRDWGTVAYDPGRDLVYMYCGGHCVYTGADVLHYHLATNRWEQPVPTEEPLGMIAASGVSVPGVNFNRRPWMTNHTWNSYEYHPKLKKMVVAGRLTGWSQPQPDPYFYLYDPDRAEWARRHPVGGMHNNRMSVQLCWTPKGMLAWSNGLWLLDAAGLKWKPLKFEGKLRRPVVDNTGLIYDAKRDRVLFFVKGYGDKNPYAGVIPALDMKTLKLSEIKPAGSGEIARLTARKKGRWYLREVVHDPESDLFLWNSRIGGDCLPAYEPAKNRWIGVKIKGAASFGHAVGMIYDARRKLIWAIDGHRGGLTWALRFDAKKAAIKPLKELEAVPPSPGRK